jgi:hypothetical protein
MSQIKLELHLDEVNMVLASLGQLPFVQVAGLVDKIKEQATPQVPVPDVSAVPEVPETVQ